MNEACPKCGCENGDVFDNHVGDGWITFKCTCSKCDAMFKLHYDLIFAESELIYD